MPEFAHPQLLWLLVGAFIPVLLGIAEKKQPRSSLRILVAALRSCALGSLVVALAAPLKGTREATTDIMFALDVSKSISSETTERALTLINQIIEEKRSDARIGLVVFAADAGVEALLSTNAHPHREIDSHVERDGTNISKALEVALGAFADEGDRRIVVLSDGRETIGNALRSAAIARGFGVQIHSISLEPPKRGDEVWLRNIEVPSRVHVDEPFKIRVSVHTSVPSPAHLVVTRNGALLYEENITLAAGENAVPIVEQVPTPGLYEYEAVINSSADTVQENNRYQTFVQVSGPPRVLHVGDEEQPSRSLNEALRAQGLATEEIAPSDMPNTLHALSNYDLIVLNNVSSFALSLTKMELLEEFVRDGGGGIITLGGQNSYSAGGYQDTPLERLLPVNMDVQTQVKIPTLTVVILVDKSGSMSSKSLGEEKLDTAKIAALSAIDVLNAHDRVGVLAFDANQEWSVEPTEVSERDAIVEKLRALTAGGGTNLHGALQEAHRVIANSQAKVKHLIVLSDGLTDVEADFDAQARAIADDGITISTVAFGSNADRDLLSALAARGKGRFYFTEDSRNVPRIFTSETLVASRNLIVEQPTQPLVTHEGEVISGFTQDDFPRLRGFQRTFGKAAAQMNLSTSDGDPLLATWRYGLGRSTAFTSDLNSRWGRDWLVWPEYGRFVAQLARWTLRRRGTERLLPQFEVEGEQGEITVDAVDRNDRFVNGLQMTTRVTGPVHAPNDIALTQTAPGRYQSTFDVPRPGRYYFSVRGHADGVNVGPQTFAFAVPYSSEFLHLGADHDMLRAMASAAGGQALPLTRASMRLVTAANPKRKSQFEKIWWPFIVLALVLIIIELALRKFAVNAS